MEEDCVRGTSQKMHDEEHTLFPCQSKSDLGLHLSQSFSLLNSTIRTATFTLKKFHKDNSCYHYYALGGSYIGSYLKDHSHWKSLFANISKSNLKSTFSIRFSFLYCCKRVSISFWRSYEIMISICLNFPLGLILKFLVDT